MERTQFTSMIRPIARATALFIGIFILLNLDGSRRVTGFDANIWWIDLRFLSHRAATVYLAMAAVALMGFALGWPWQKRLRISFGLVIASLAAVAFCNSVSFYALWNAGRIEPGMPLPLSLPSGLMLVLIAVTLCRPIRPMDRRQRIAFAAAFLATMAVFPLAQMLCFGKTDYRRQADAIVVFGARAYADGTPSFVLADRTRTAVRLYQQGLAPVLIFSGGPGDGATSEPQAMKNMAVSMGVPASAITLDEHGLNTESTVADTVPIFRQRHLTKVLAVSNFYHLPRVKLAYDRALSAQLLNVQLLTVPADDPKFIRQMPIYVAREIPAIWTYYLRPLI